MPLSKFLVRYADHAHARHAIYLTLEHYGITQGRASGASSGIGGLSGGALDLSDIVPSQRAFLGSRDRVRARV